MSNSVPLSQTPEVNKLIEEDEFVGQVAGLSMKTILAACTALESLTDDIQKGMNSLKEKALLEYKELLEKLETPNMDWVQFAQFIRDQQARAVQSTEKDATNENSAMKAVERVFEEEQLRVVARQALELEEAWEDSCVQPARSYSPSPAPDSLLVGQDALSRKRPRRTLDNLETPNSLLAGAPRLSVKMTPKLASCAKRFAEELSTMRRVDSRRVTQTGFVLLSADPSTKKSLHSNSFRLSSVLGATASRQETEPLKESLDDTRPRPRYTFGQNAITDEEWQEAHEEMSCASSRADSCSAGHVEDDCPVPMIGTGCLSPRDSGVEVAVDDDDDIEEMRDDHQIDDSMTEESSSSATEGDDGTEEEDNDENETSRQTEGMMELPQPHTQHADKDCDENLQTAATQIDQTCAMSDGEVSELESAGSNSDRNASGEEEAEELSPTSSCDSEEVPNENYTLQSNEDGGGGAHKTVERSPMSGFVPSAVGALLKTPLVRIQEKLGAFGKSRLPHSEEVPSVSRRPDLDRKLYSAEVASSPPQEVSSPTNKGKLGKKCVTENAKLDNGLIPSAQTAENSEPQKRSYHRFLKPLGPKNPINSADISGIDQGFEKRMWVETAAWARGDLWQKEVKRQAKWNPYSLFGYGVKAAQFSDVFQTPDFRRATSNVRYNMPERTDGRISRMNRWEVDKIACAFNESEGMTQEQLGRMVELLNKTEDISDLAYEQTWIKCTPECSHDAGKKQPWHREEVVVGQR